MSMPAGVRARLEDELAELTGGPRLAGCAGARPGLIGSVMWALGIPAMAGIVVGVVMGMAGKGASGPWMWAWMWVWGAAELACVLVLLARPDVAAWAGAWAFWRWTRNEMGPRVMRLRADLAEGTVGRVRFKVTDVAGAPEVDEDAPAYLMRIAENAWLYINSHELAEFGDGASEMRGEDEGVVLPRELEITWLRNARDVVRVEGSGEVVWVGIKKMEEGVGRVEEVVKREGRMCFEVSGRVG